MKLASIYRPIEKELEGVDDILKSSLKRSKNRSISRINDFLIGSRGKRIRPALVILSAKATSGSKPSAVSHQLIKIASAIELIHMASLIHDDVIDHSRLRHNKPTINSKWGEDVAITLGDYLYSEAFELISTCGNTDILQCISSATKAMCEGELLQVCERDNLDLLKERYLLIVKKKTAALFAASCQVGTLISNSQETLQTTFKEYGLNFGIAFQIIDDYLDLVGREDLLGKSTGADIRVGELTLPLLYLLDKAGMRKGKEIKKLFSLCREDKDAFKDAFSELKERLTHSSAVLKTEAEARFYTQKAKGRLKELGESPLKRSLLDLADYIVCR